MSHPYESFVDDQRTATLRRTMHDNVRSCNSFIQYEASQTTSEGYVRVGHRAASKKSSPDAYGWRMPTAYDGHLEGHSVNSGLQNVAEFTYQQSQSYCKCGSSRCPGHRRYEGFKTNQATYLVGLSYATAIARAKTLKSTAEMKALVGFKDVKVDLSTAFMERKKTAKLLSSAAHNVAHLAWSIRRGRFFRNYVPRTPQDGLDLLKDKWLEARYAWSPLLQDLYGSLEALQARDNSTYRRYIITSTGKAAGKFATQGENSPSGGTLYVGGETSLSSFRVLSRTEMEFECRVRLDAALTVSEYRRLQDVGVTDPQSTAWELLPWSFVCDWFVGVGDYLSAVNALSGYSFKGGTCTAFYKGTEEHDYKIFPAWRDVTYDPVLFRKAKSCLATGFDRSVYLVAPSASIVLKQQPLNLTRATDAIALLWDAFGRRRPSGSL